MDFPIYSYSPDNTNCDFPQGSKSWLLGEISKVDLWNHDPEESYLRNNPRDADAYYEVESIPTSEKPSAKAQNLLAERFTNSFEDAAYESLISRPDLVSLFLDSVEPIEAYFGADTPISLTSVCEPGSDDGLKFVALIHTSKEVREGVHLLQEFKKEWWYPRMQEFGREANFNISFD